MEIIKLNFQDRLVCDPCYIKSVKKGENIRFDALKCIDTLHDGGDGDYPISTTNSTHWLGCDSGRIWVMIAEFDCEIAIDSGLSGHLIIRKGSSEWGEDIILGAR